MDFSAYDFDDETHDEMFVAEGVPRPHWRHVHETLRDLPDDDLNTLQERVTRSFSQEGITFTVYGDEEAADSPIEHVLASGLHVADGAGERVAANASHAWVECFLPGAGWIGFDPTNASRGGERHIRVATGPGCADVIPHAGSLPGRGGCADRSEM